jgi:NAD(P)-dependent dehydrogenase (short-subunit alcohol dehydrogenase family)
MTTTVITGASSGVGAAAARALATLGHELAIVGRDPERTRRVAEEVGGIAFTADFDRLDDVRRLARELAAAYPRIDVLANNAGGLLAHRELSADGVEQTWQHNVLAPFVLTTELLPLLRRSDARVLFTGSVAHRWGSFDATDVEFRRRRWLGGAPAYGQAKRADMMLARELARRTGLDAWSFHPGFVRSRFGGDRMSTTFGQLLQRAAVSPDEGAVPLVLLASMDEPLLPVGGFLDRTRPGTPAAQVLDDDAGAQLWGVLERQAARLAGDD